MHASALSQIVPYLGIFEGGLGQNPITWMYLDSIGLVSTGVGILIDPLEQNKTKVTFYQPGGDGTAGAQRAADDEVKKEFDFVKSKAAAGGDGKWKPMPGFADYRVFEPLTRLRLRASDLQSTSLKIVVSADATVRNLFGPDYDTWPADVQVAVVQMAYAGGLKTRLDQGLAPLLKSHDWYSARDYTYLSNPQQGRNGYLKHNRALDILMTNGWIVSQCKALGTKMKYANMSPQDHTKFYGLNNYLSVARWSDGQDVSPEVKEDDLITTGDCQKWLDNWYLTQLASKQKGN